MLYLIYCKDYQKVSSMAEKCPDCGYPLAANRTDGEVAIVIMSGLAGKVKILDADNGDSIIWKGRAGQIARFNIQKDTRIGIGWGVRPNTPSSEVGINLVKAGKKYELKMTRGFFFNKITLVEIDTIDSGL